MVYATQYYPTAASTQQATGVTVRSGEERGGVDMQLRMVPALNITGHLMMPDGPAMNWGVHLVPGDTSDLSADPDVATSITNSDGEFAFLAVPAGQYVIQTVRVPRPGPGAGAQTFVFSTGGGGAGTVAFSSNVSVSSTNGTPQPPPLPTDPTLWTATPIVLGSDDISDLTISLRSGFKVSGRVEFQGSADRPPADRLVQIPVTLEPADGRQKTQSIPGRVDAQGNFTTMGLLPGKYFVRIGGAPSGWTFKSAVLGGTDVSETPIEIEDRDVPGIVVTFNDTPTDLRGTVKSADGVADDSSAVVVFPSDNRAWMDYGINPRRVRIARTSKTGTYSFGALPAGDYYVAAFSEEFAGEWQDPRFLDQLSRGATRVTLNDAEKRTQDLTRLNARPGGGPHPSPAAIDEPALGGPYVPEIDQLTQQTQTQAPPRDTKPAPTPTPKPGTPARDTPDPGAGTASVSGVVVLDDATQSPLRRTRVTLRGVDTRAERTVTTDDMGRFAFAGIAAGNYSLVAAKAAYVQAFYGSKHAGRGPGTPLSIANGQNMTDLKLMMPRGGVVTGRAIDDFGAPVPNASVRLLQYRNVSGERTLQPVGVGNIVTDDRGIYRAYGLTPGAYVVSLAPPIYGGLGSDLRMLSPNDMQAAIAAVQQGSMQIGRDDAGRHGQRAESSRGRRGCGAGDAAAGQSRRLLDGLLPGDVVVARRAGRERQRGTRARRHRHPRASAADVAARRDGDWHGRPTRGGRGVDVRSRSARAARSEISRRFAPGRTASSRRRTSRPATISSPRAAAADRHRRRRTGRRCGCGAAATSASPATATAWRERDQLWRRHLRGRRAGGAPLRAAGAGFRRRGRYRCHADAAGRHDGLRQDRLRGPDADGAGRSVAIVDRARPRRAARDPDRPAYRADNADGRVHDVRRHAWQVPAHGERARQHRLDAEVVDHRRARHARRLARDQGRTERLGRGSDVHRSDGRAFGPADRRRGQTGAGLHDPALLDRPRVLADGITPRAAAIQPASDGKFRATGLPAGEYYLAAVTDLDPQDWGDPAFMDQIVPGAIKITVGDGEKKVQDLKVGGIDLERHALAASHRDPDDRGEHEDGGAERAAEEPDSAVEDRLALHLDVHVDRLAGAAIGERLFPAQDVAALDVARAVVFELAHVVPDDLARQVELERDELAAVPVHVARIARGGRADLLLEVDAGVIVLERVRRPREHAALAKRPHVVGLHADLHEAAALAPPGLADADDVAALRLERPPDVFLIDARGCGRIELDAAQSDERGDRCVDDDGRRTAHGQVDLLFVLVLAKQRAAAGAHRHAQEHRDCRPDRPTPHRGE